MVLTCDSCEDEGRWTGPSGMGEQRVTEYRGEKCKGKERRPVGADPGGCELWVVARTVPPRCLSLRIRVGSGDREDPRRTLATTPG